MSELELSPEVMSYLKSGKTKKLGKLFINNIRKTDPSNRTAIYDDLGKIAVKYPKALDDFFELFIRNIEGRLSIKELFEMDKYILEKFCLYSGENIISSFCTEVTMGKMVYEGRGYLTPFRFILIGKKTKVKGTASKGMMLGGLAAGAYVVMRSRIADKIKEKIKKQFGDQSRGIYGMMFPVDYTYDMSIKKTKIGYKFDIDIEEKGKIKNKTIELIIDIKRCKNQSKKEFLEALENIKDEFYEILFKKETKATFKVPEKVPENSPIEAEIKNLNKCPKCGWILSSIATKCPKCGWKKGNDINI
ncbi:MAG: zinc ribbon domain-containing protein [Promethearchaeia archaeon]